MCALPSIVCKLIKIRCRAFKLKEFAKLGERVLVAVWIWQEGPALLLSWYVQRRGRSTGSVVDRLAQKKTPLIGPRYHLCVCNYLPRLAKKGTSEKNKTKITYFTSKYRLKRSVLCTDTFIIFIYVTFQTNSKKQLFWLFSGYLIPKIAYHSVFNWAQCKYLSKVLQPWTKSSHSGCYTVKILF